MPPPLCRFFNGRLNSCRNGDSCPFLHSDPLMLGRLQSKDHYLPRNGSQGNIPDYYNGFRKPDPKYKYVAPKSESISISGNEINQRACSKIHVENVRTKGLCDTEIKRISKTDKESCMDGGSNTDKSSKDYAYSLRSHLSAEDIQRFEAEEFVFGHIPMLPPPKSLA